MAKLESLIVDLQVNSAALQEGLEAANKKLDAFDKNLKDLAGVVVFEKFAKQAGSAVSSLVHFALAGAEATDRMGKLAQASGMSVEAFSRLAYAGELSGVGVEALGGAFVKLDANMSKAVSGGKEQAAVFQALGVKVTDSTGKMRGADAVMGDLAERFSGMADGAAKSRLAGELFGNALGSQMIPMLNAGREGLKALGDEADRFGVTVTGEAAAAAEAFNDNLAKLQIVATAVGKNVAAQLAPTLTTLTDELINSASGAELLKDVTWILAGVLKTLASVGVILGNIFNVIGQTIARVASAVLDAAHGDFDAAKNLVGDFAHDVKEGAAKTKATLTNMWEASEPPAKAARKTFGKAADQTVADAAAIAKAATESEAAFKSLEKVALGFEAQVEGFGGTALDELKGKLEKGELADQLAKLGDKAAAMRDRIIEAATELENLKSIKLANELGFTVSRAEKAQKNEDSSNRTRFSQAGAGPTAMMAARTKGFDDYDAALRAASAATLAAVRSNAEAEAYKAKGDIQNANLATEAADKYKHAGMLAGDAANAFADLAGTTGSIREKMIGDAASAGTWGDAMAQLKKDFEVGLHSMPDFGATLGVWFKRMSAQLGAAGTQMLGAVGELVNSVVQGAEAGGIWGAIIAAFMEIAKRTASALAFLDTAMQFIEKIAAMVEPLVKPIFAALQGVLEIVADIVAPVFEALKPFFWAIGDLVENLGPIIWAIGDLLAAISPIIEFIGNVVGGMIDFLAPLFEVIGGVIKAIATVVLGFLIMLNEIAAAVGDEKAAKEAKRMRKLVDTMWSEDDKAKSSFNPRAETTTSGNVTATGKVTATGAIETKAFDLSKWIGDTSPMDVIDIGGWGYAAGSEAGAQAARAFVDSMMLINGASSDDALAAGEEAYVAFLALGDSADEASKSLATFSNSLTNTPAGFRYAAEAFNATGVGGGTLFQDAQPTQGSLTVIVEGSVMSELELVNIIEQHQRRSGYRKTGSGANPTDNIR